MSGLIPDLGGGFGVVVVNYPSNGIQNGGPDGIALANGTTLVQFLSYEGVFAGVGAPVNGQTSTDIGVSENGSEPLGGSLALGGVGDQYGELLWTKRDVHTFGLVEPITPTAPPIPPVRISEIHYDNDGVDTGEAIEVTGPAGVNLAGWSLVLYNLTGGADYATIPLGGVLPDEGAGLGAAAFPGPASGIQNGPADGVALVEPLGSVVEFLSYEGTLTAAHRPGDR